MKTRKDVMTRFWEKVHKTEGCWVWTGSRDGCGYGMFNFNGETKRAHRVSYALVRGSVPEGLQLDHLCRNRACVNPAHLEAVTQHVNMLRGMAPAALCAAKTHCKWGHPLSGPNLYLGGNGARRCRVCIQRNNRAGKQRRKVKTQEAAV